MRRNLESVDAKDLLQSFALFISQAQGSFS